MSRNSAKQAKISKESAEFKPTWSPEELLTRKTSVDLNVNVSRNIIDLVDNGATIPFIARYRKEMTGNMDVDQLKHVVTQYHEIKEIESRIQTVCKNVSNLGKMTKDLEISICMSTSMADVETLYALHKPSPKGSLAQRAKVIGLEPTALDIMAGRRVHLEKLVNPNIKGLESVGDIEKGIGHIIADVIAKDKEAFDRLRLICHSNKDFVLTSCQSKSLPKGKEKKAMNPKQIKSAGDVGKFEQYYSFTVSARNPPPHVVLALNRGEECKALTVKVVVPDSVKRRFLDFAGYKFITEKGLWDASITRLIRSSISDAYERLMEPTLCRQTRSELTRTAEKEAITVFASNLKCVLLSTPTRNRTVLGIDPGFRNGCKVAVISPIGSVLDTAVVYLHPSKSMVERNKISSLIHKYGCQIIGIGNGVACRETEQVVSEMISFNVFKPVDVVYCIVDECGASIYSVSDQAKKDLPDLDPTLRGAVSIARRLIDPLAEFVKIEPQHLGVGMYQHDVSKTKLQTALDSVVEECVSFVGVDLNTCSECLLKRVSGLNAAKAKKIIEWREKNGAFINRHQLLDIKGLGEKGFEQCAGFVRILHDRNKYGEKTEPSNKQDNNGEDVDENGEIEPGGRKRKAGAKGKMSKSKKAKFDGPTKWNPFDCTAIHPESYDLANSFLAFIGVSSDNLGTDTFIKRVKEKSSIRDLNEFKDKHGVSFASAEFIACALTRPITFDLRDGSQKPLFRRGVRSMLDLKIGETLTGRVNNVTHFGAFVDIGVGVNGLIHSSQIWLNGRPKTGDHVEVKVENIDKQRNRIGLALVIVLEQQSFSKMLL